MKNWRLYLLTICLNLFSPIVGDRCCRTAARERPIYGVSMANRRSTMTIVARKRVSSLKNCERFAASKRALAFNYREPSMRNRGRGHQREWSNANCQALECPEIHGFSQLVNGTRFSYHSVYEPRKTTANGTLTCLPRVGVFYISEDRVNYSNAQSSCKNLSGILAHVVSEERTEGLGKFVNDVPTFVGLSNRREERLWKTELNEPLSCFHYRGWAINEPSHARGCVGLVKPPKIHGFSSWRVLPCSRKSPYICEILPQFSSAFPSTITREK